MYVFKDICSNYCVQICIHEVKYKVNVSIIFSSDYVLKADNVFVPSQLLQENYLTESSLCVCSILEGVEILLQCYNFFGTFVNSFPNNTISSFAQFLKNFVFSKDVGFKFFRHLLILIN